MTADIPQPTWLDGELSAYVIELGSHKAGFVHLADRPLLASDTPAALRRIATVCAELADRLEARHVPCTQTRSAAPWGPYAKSRI